LSIHRGPLNDDEPYLRSVVLQQWLFGYELPDIVIVLTQDGDFYMLATKKKLELLKPAVGKHKAFKLHLLLRNKEDNNAAHYETLMGQLKGGKIGVISKERDANKENAGGILGPWEAKLDSEAGNDDLVDITHGLALVMAAKDASERDLMKKSSVLSNKVMKHGCVKRLEEIIEEEAKITHEAFATEIEAVLEDPGKIKLNVPPDDVQSCYFPIIQSGGNYDIKVSAQSTSDTMKFDVITVALGARYKMYCSNIARTFLVDPPKKVSETYETLLEMQEACLEAMRPGAPLKSVYKAAVSYLQKNGHEDLIPKLPKNLGFAQGLEFRDSALLLSAKNSVQFKEGMVFCLSVGFTDLELSESDRAGTPDKSAVSFF
jgi:nucleosome binding factor SPN SPT16 subunit